MTTERAALLVLALLVPLAGFGQSAAPTPFPPHMAMAGWTPHSEERHPEYLRFTLRNGDRTTGLEVVPSKANSCEWCSRRYRLQPAPGQSPPDELLAAALVQLRRFDETTAASPFSTQPRPAKPGARSPVPREDTVAAWQIGLERFAAVAYLGFGLLLGGTMVGAARRDRRNLVGITCIPVGVALVQVVPWLQPPGLTLLHEGTTRHVVDALYGQVDHAGPAHMALVHWVARGTSLPLTGAWALNGVLHGLNAGLAIALVRDVAGRWLPAAIAATALWATPWLRIAAGSELAAGATTTLLIGALWGLHAKNLPLIGVATVLLGLTRIEWAGMGLVLLALAAARARWGETGLHDRSQALAAVWRKRPAWQRWVLIVVVAATVPLAFSGGYPAWAWAALNPLVPTILAAPFWLLAATSPGVVALTSAGIRFAWRHSVEAAAILVALAGVFKLYFGASHRVYFEMARYSSMLLPFVALLAAAGWHALDRWTQVWPPQRRRIGAAVIVAALAVPPVDALTDLVWDWRPDRTPHLHRPLQRDLQRELAFLVRAVRTHPTCTLATRTTREQERVDTPQAYDFVFFGGRLPHPERVPADRPLLDAAKALVPAAPCLLFARGLDCNLVHGRNCDDIVAGMPVVAQEWFASLPYSDPVEYGRVKPTVTLDLAHIW